MASEKIDRVLFARIGWMNFYSGIVPGDAEIIGGGAYNQTEIGSEVLNFATHEDRVYGFVQGTRGKPLTLERIDPGALGRDTLNSTLVIFVARRPDNGGQVIVGWYRNATIHRELASDPRPAARRLRDFNMVTKRQNAILLPTNERWQSVPTGFGAFGQANVCYAREQDGNRKKARWIRKAVDYVLGYSGPNLVKDRDIEIQNQSAEQAEVVRAAAQGQGFASTPAQRRAIEDHAMARALKHFDKRFSKVENVSKQKGLLDLRCGSSKRTRVFVEVKGTTTDGESVILTRMELERARSSTCALYVLHSIKLNGDNASGGTERVIYKWAIGKGRLTPINFNYRLP